MEHCLQSYMGFTDNYSWPQVPIRELTDLELIDAYISTRQETLWQEFYRRFDVHIRVYIKKSLRSYESTIFLTQTDSFSLKEDLVQEIYLKLLRNDCQVLKNFNGKNNCFHAYLHKITTTTVIDHFRQYKRQKRQAQILPLEVFFEEKHIPIVNKKSSYMYSDLAFETVFELKDIVNKALMSCQNKQNKKIFLLFVILGLTSPEITQEQGLNVGKSTVESVVRKVRKEIKRLFTIN